MSTGIKHDEEKVPLDLLDPQALEQIAKVLQFGAKKYAAHNWRGGIKYSRLIAATLRHIYTWVRGEDYDPETGLNHLAHAGCEIMFLLNFATNNRTELDDRFKG